MAKLGAIDFTSQVYSKTAVDNLLRMKQDVLVFDDTPTAGSVNPVTSWGIKLYVDDSIAGLGKILNWCGSVPTYADLPTENVRPGDVYNVEEDGMNVAATLDDSNDIVWDPLGPSMDVYLTKEEAASTYLSKTDAAQTYLSKDEAVETYLTKSQADEYYDPYGAASAVDEKYHSLPEDIREVYQNLVDHATDYNNPHQVTKSQVGLGNVDNTSDLNKPISFAVQSALNNKVSKTGDTMTGGLTVPNLTVGSRGYNSAVGVGSTAEGSFVIASGDSSHAEGAYTTATGVCAHAEGGATVSSGFQSHAEGADTIAQNEAEHAQGCYNDSHKATDTFGDAGNTLSSVGFGSEEDRKNAVETMQDGKTFIYGLGGYDGTNPTGSGAKDLATSVNEKASAADLSNHVANTSNPHQVTKSQVGLGNVDNTSDLDKPVSTAVQSALNLKQDQFVVLKYGVSTWAEFQEAYQKNAVIFCLNGSRMGIIGYVTATQVEFNYYRSIQRHTASNQGDQFFVYKLDESNTWSAATRETMLRNVSGNGIETTVVEQAGLGTISYAVKPKTGGGIGVDANGVYIDLSSLSSVSSQIAAIKNGTAGGSDLVDVMSALLTALGA